MIEHEYTRKVNAKINAYNLEIALLELGPKRKPNRGKGQHLNLVQWAWQHLGEGKSYVKAPDEEIMAQCYFKKMSTMFPIIKLYHENVDNSEDSLIYKYRDK